MNGYDLAASARAMIDGVFVGDFNFEGDNIDIVVIRDPAIEMTPDEVPDQPIAVRGTEGRATVLPLGQLVDFVSANASQAIRRVEQQRAISLTVSPPADVALEEAQAKIMEIVDETRREGHLGIGVFVNLSGNADRLSQVRASLMGSWDGWSWESLMSVGLSRFFLALLITYLLMAALFESFLHPLVILFSVPMATVGGFIGLAIVHRVNPSQQLDVLTMLGFVILIGVRLSGQSQYAPDGCSLKMMLRIVREITVPTVGGGWLGLRCELSSNEPPVCSAGENLSEISLGVRCSKNRKGDITDYVNISNVPFSEPFRYALPR